MDWAQATKVFKVLLISPLVGFICAALLFCVSKLTIKYPALYEAPKDNTPPPWPIRLLLVLTCSGVSFSHGSNDGQKGMGLIMLILIGTVPTAYALNHAVTAQGHAGLHRRVRQGGSIVERPRRPECRSWAAIARTELSLYLQTKQLQPDTMTALRESIRDLEGNGARPTATTSMFRPAQQTNIRNDMYVTSETLRVMAKSKDHQLQRGRPSCLEQLQGQGGQGHQVHSRAGSR